MVRWTLLLMAAVLMVVPVLAPQAAVAEEDPIAGITAKFWWWTTEAAMASGFMTDGRCIDSGMAEMGAMGVHYTKQAHVDGTFNAMEPEALVFDPLSGKVVAVEYIVVSGGRPWAFGQQFDPHRPIPGAWALHLWLLENKNGRFSPWNPAVKCSLDPAKETVLVAEARMAEMRIKLELEPAKAMSMLMDGQWTEMAMAEGKYHVEVKPEDPRSNTRISYADVRFSAVNRDTGAMLELDLHPMWGGSGLHYAANSDLPDGTYSATVVVGPPSFVRSGADRERWMAPTQAHFEFKLEKGLLISGNVVEGAPMVEMPAPAPAPMPGMVEMPAPAPAPMPGMEGMRGM